MAAQAHGKRMHEGLGCAVDGEARHGDVEVEGAAEAEPALAREAPAALAVDGERGDVEPAR